MRGPCLRPAGSRRDSELTGPAIDDIIRLGQAIRHAEDARLYEVASTRALIASARLMRIGLPLRAATVAAIVSPLTDDIESREALDDADQFLRGRNAPASGCAAILFGRRRGGVIVRLAHHDGSDVMTRPSGRYKLPG